MAYASDSYPFTRDIAEPTCNTFNFSTRLSTYLQDFPLTYKTSNLPTRHTPDRKLDSPSTYKTINQLVRLYTNLQDFEPIDKTLNQLTRH